jgi:PIN domain nuclease of toxin-antitoxin system
MLDTHVLVWLASDPGKLSKRAADSIRQASHQGGLAIAAITLWEISWLATNRRVQISGTVESFVEKISSRTTILPITVRIATLANQFTAAYSRDSRDPCDRLIGATALSEGIALITKDKNIRQSGELQTIW